MKVVILGEALCDLFAIDAEGRPTSSEHAHGYVRLAGGAPTNFAIGLARRGLAVELMSELGDDPMGRFLVASLRAEGIATDAIRVSRRAKTGVSFISIDARHMEAHDLGRLTIAGAVSQCDD